MPDKIPLTDPRVLALAKARQQLAHEGMLLPTWDELTPDEQEQSLPDARNYLESAVRAGLLHSDADRDARVRTAALSEASGKLRLTLFPAVYEDAGQRTAQGVRRAADALDRMAAVSAPGGE
jgi:hypothetical protein